MNTLANILPLNGEITGEISNHIGINQSNTPVVAIRAGIAVAIIVILLLFTLVA